MCVCVCVVIQADFLHDTLQTMTTKRAKAAVPGAKHPEETGALQVLYDAHDTLILFPSLYVYTSYV